MLTSDLVRRREIPLCRSGLERMNELVETEQLARSVSAVFRKNQQRRARLPF